VKPKPLDYIAIIVAIAVTALTVVSAYRNPGGTEAVEISAAGGIWVYPLQQERTVEVDGPLGTTILRFEDGSVRFTDSPCPHKYCVLHGPLRGAGQWNACLPNRVFVKIRGQRAKRIDAHSH
jgi:hypothetical protein